MNGNNGSIVGQVVDTEGMPVAGVIVSLTAGSAPFREIAALTDAEGRFRLGNLAPGRYKLAATLSATITATAETTVHANQSTEVTIRINTAPEVPDGQQSEVGSSSVIVDIVPDHVDWRCVQSVRVTLRYAGKSGGAAKSEEILFSSTYSGRVQRALPDSYRIIYFYRGGGQKTIGPVNLQAPQIVLNPFA